MSSALSCVVTLVILSQSPADTQEAMVRAFGTLARLQPLLANPVRFADPANNEEIRRDLGTLAGVQHTLPFGAFSEDPGMALGMINFGGRLQEAEQSLLAGRAEASRQELANVTGLCLECHARAGATAQLLQAGDDIDRLPVAALTKGDYFAATHQYDKALAAYDRVMSGPRDGEQGTLDFYRALRHALQVQVVVKGQPDATIALLERAESGAPLPGHLARAVEAWKKDARAWRADRFDPKRADAGKLLAHARGLMTGALPPALPGSRDDLRLMRAANELHAGLRSGASGDVRTETLFLLGICHSELEEPHLGGLDEFYWESCVREAPHSSWARKCFQREFDHAYWRGAGPDLRLMSELRALSE